MAFVLSKKSPADTISSCFNPSHLGLCAQLIHHGWCFLWVAHETFCGRTGCFRQVILICISHLGVICFHKEQYQVDRDNSKPLCARHQDPASCHLVCIALPILPVILCKLLSYLPVRVVILTSLSPIHSVLSSTTCNSYLSQLNFLFFSHIVWYLRLLSLVFPSTLPILL